MGMIALFLVRHKIVYTSSSYEYPRSLRIASNLPSVRYVSTFNCLYDRYVLVACIWLCCRLNQMKTDRVRLTKKYSTPVFFRSSSRSINFGGLRWCSNRWSVCSLSIYQARTMFLFGVYSNWSWNWKWKWKYFRLYINIVIALPLWFQRARRHHTNQFFVFMLGKTQLYFLFWFGLEQSNRIELASVGWKKKWIAIYQVYSLYCNI